VTNQAEQIRDMKEPAPTIAPVATFPPAPVMAPRRAGRRILGPLRLLAAGLTWLMVGIFLIGGAVWAFRSGMEMRRDVWQQTRSIRFKEDIMRGFQFGNDTLRFAENQAHLQPKADALAGQTPAVLARAGYTTPPTAPGLAFRRLTTKELIDGLVGYMDDIVQNNPGGDYDLDYPPLRLLVMTLWVRHVQRIRPEMDTYPGQRVEDGALGQDEDVAEPLLEFNAYCAAAGAVGIFLLVWLWVRRSFKPFKPLRIPLVGRWWKGSSAKALPPIRNHLAFRWTVPHGIFAFMLATIGFWYAYQTLVQFPPRPSPMISVVQIQPGEGGATIIANINSQGQDNTQWRVDFGSSPAYGRSSELQSADNSLDDQQLSMRIPAANGQRVHFRIWATGPGGTTTTDDFSFVNGNRPAIDVNSTPVGGLVWPDMWVWLRLLALFIVMVLAAERLPAIHRGWACGAVAAMLVWCDPLVLIDSHAWPQWDIWILPIFIFAALLASLNWWMLAGILLGIGCMFKGQLLLGGPILVLWPLLGGRWGAFVRIAIGCIVGAELITWPWIVNSADGLRWIEAVAGACAIIVLASLMRRTIVREFRRWVIEPILGRRDKYSELLVETGEQLLVTALLVGSAVLAAVTIAMALVFHGVVSRPGNLPAGTLGLFFLLVLIPPWIIRRRSIGVWLAGVLSIAVWISAQVFGGSYSWATLGFAYGSVKHDLMQMSIRNFSNLTSILGQTYQWDIHQQMGTLKLNFTTPGPWRIGPWAIPSVAWTWSVDMDVKTTMAILYGICLLIASAAAALHSRRNDRRFLVALVVPWLVFPMVMCQMGDRYPIWASCLSAAMVAVSLELSLLHVVLAVISFAMVAKQLATFDGNRWPQLLQLMNPTFPGIGWLLIFLTAIFLVAALAPSGKWSMGSRSEVDL
jgi:hypothetical protein